MTGPRCRFLVSLISFLLASSAQWARAAVVELRYQAEIVGISAGVVPDGLAVGGAVTGYMRYDRDAVGGGAYQLLEGGVAAGEYQASFTSGTAAIYNYPGYYYTVPYTYSCGFFSTCTSYNTHYQPGYSSVAFNYGPSGGSDDFARLSLSGNYWEWGTSLANVGLDDLLRATLAFGTADDGTVGRLFARLTSAEFVSPVSAVPLPGAVWLFGSALLGMLSLKRRGSKKASASGSLAAA